MRLLACFFICFTILVSTSCNSSKNIDSSSKTEKSLSELQEKLLSKKFEFDALRVLPMGSAMIDLAGNNYSVIFQQDIITSFLPFYGTRTSGPTFGKSKGMSFEGEPESFEVLKIENGFQVDAKVKTREDSFLISMYVRESGYATLTITTKTRSTISYEGEIR